MRFTAIQLLIIFSIAYQSLTLVIPLFNSGGIPRLTRFLTVFIFFVPTFGFFYFIYSTSLLIQNYLFSHTTDSTLLELVNILLYNISYYLSGIYISKKLNSEPVPKQELAAERYISHLAVAKLFVPAYLVLSISAGFLLQ